MDTGSYANPAQAALALRRGLQAEPGNLTIRLGLMELFRQQGRLDEARTLGEAGLALAGPAAALLLLQGLILAELGATAALLEWVGADPREAEAALHAGTHAVSVGRMETGLALLGRGLELRPDDFQAWLTLVKALIHSHRLAEAAARVEWLLARPIADAELRAQIGFLGGVALLLQGRLVEGLPYLENRFVMAGGPRPPALPLAPWQGGDLAGRTLVLQAEQGFGDTFMMARYVPILAGRGARVLLQPLAGTEAVLATCPGLAGFAQGDLTLPGDGLKAPLMALPMLCGTDLATIPAAVPYLSVPAQVPNRAAIDACLAGAAQPRRIGLVWAGNPAHNQDAQRSMAPELLDLLAEVPGVSWADLQVAPGPRPSLPLLDLAPHLRSFADTAYALAQLDGLITVDSSPLHLAGALGRPAWLLLAHLPDWRWMLERRDTPWYPTVELWRQPTPGDWISVLEAMRDRLERWPFETPLPVLSRIR